MKNIFLALVLLHSGLVLATPQIMDRMYVEGENLRILNSPLAPIISSKGKQWLEEVWFVAVPQFECSASWHGYYVQWYIENDKLYLEAIFGDPCSEEPNLIDSHVIFLSMISPIFAHWFTGEIPVQVSELSYVENIIVNGERRAYWHKCTSKYFIFESGILKGTETRETYDDCYVF